MTTSPLAQPDALDEALERLHHTGPEFEGWLSNHGPMAVEALCRRGHGDTVSGWVDAYSRRLEESPAAYEPITATTWREALGDPRRLGDWPVWFAAELAERQWTDVLATWWPRLLPGVAASATHGVIRVGHVVKVLRESGETPERIAELGQALGYWAARWQQVPATAAPAGRLDVASALRDIPRIPDRSGGINSRLAQLDSVADWPTAQRRAAAPPAVEDAPAFLRDVVAASVIGYGSHARANPVMLVHAATAPNAILRTLPSLPHEQWVDSAAAGWSAAAAIVAVYAPAGAGQGTSDLPETTEEEAFAVAVANGDEHAIKLADTALDVHRWTGDPRALHAAHRAATLIGE